MSFGHIEPTTPSQIRGHSKQRAQLGQEKRTRDRLTGKGFRTGTGPRIWPIWCAHNEFIKLIKMALPRVTLYLDAPLYHPLDSKQTPEACVYTSKCPWVRGYIPVHLLAWVFVALYEHNIIKRVARRKDGDLIKPFGWQQPSLGWWGWKWK